MKKRIKVINKLVEETINGKFIVDLNLEPIEVIRMGEKEKKLIEHDGFFWTFAKTRFEKKKAIRMVFALREKTKKVYNVGRITDLIAELENVFVYVDRCEITNSDNFIYLDVVKKL